MKMQYMHGNVLEMTTGDAPQLIVHGCNCFGEMGSGVAKAIRDKYPKAYEEYRRVHESEGDWAFSYTGLKLGTIVPVEVEPKKWIVNAMTQPGYRGRTNRRSEFELMNDLLGERCVSYDAVFACFEKVRDFAYAQSATGPLPYVLFPKIGAGLGGGNWEIIEPIIEEALGDSLIKICVIL